MKSNSNLQLLRATLLASTVLAIPFIALAHGAVPDGHVEVAEAVAPSAGSSALIKAWTPIWWGLLGVSTLLTSALSYGVWKYLQVAPPKKSGVPEEKK